MWGCLSVSGVWSGASVSGMLTGTPFCSMGVTTMKMIRSTRQTSTSGVTLISEVIDPLISLPTELCHRFFMPRSNFLQEVDRHLRAGVRHLDREAVDAILEVVVRPDRGDGDEQTEGRRDEGFGDTGRDGGDTTPRRGHLLEGVDDADDRSEETDERRRGTDGGQNAEVLLQFRDGDHGRTVHALTRGLDGHFRIGVALVAAHRFELQQTGRDDLGQMALLVLLGDVDGLLVVALSKDVGQRAEKLQRLILGL